MADKLLTAAKQARQMINMFLWSCDPETGVIEATHINFEKWNNLLKDLSIAITEAEVTRCSDG